MTSTTAIGAMAKAPPSVTDAFTAALTGCNPGIRQGAGGIEDLLILKGSALSL
jgi:hypothetical protein